jgi:DNA modification methylase
VSRPEEYKAFGDYPRAFCLWNGSMGKSQIVETVELTWTTDRAPLGSLIEYDKNPVQISRHDAQELAKSLKKFGHIIPYTAAAPKNGGEIPILDGHQRKKVEIEILNVPPNTLVDVRFPSRALTDKERQEAIIRLRKNTGEFDPDALLNWFESDDLLDWGFDEKELGKIGFEFGGNGDAEPEIDRAAELLEKWQVKPGDLWQIGDHRIICGDCTDAATVARVMDGEKADAVIIDPPYSSGGFQEAGKSVGSIGTRSSETIKADNLSTRGYRLLLLDALTHFKNVDNLYIFTDWRMWIECFDISERAGWKVRSMIVWDKEQMGMGMPWRSQHELILFGKQASAKMLDGKCGNVLHAKRTGNENHPTEKPAELIEQLISNTDGSLFVDFFAGSGTTLVACQNLSRKCRAIEISPAYVAVALERVSTAFEGIEIRKV